MDLLFRMDNYYSKNVHDKESLNSNTGMSVNRTTKHIYICATWLTFVEYMNAVANAKASYAISSVGHALHTARIQQAFELVTNIVAPQMHLPSPKTFIAADNAHQLP